MLQQRILQELHNRDVSCIPIEPAVIQILNSDQSVFISLDNLHRAILAEPTLTEDSIEDFLLRLTPLSNTNVGVVYPRILPVEHNKALSHPWVQPFLGAYLEVALVEHCNGRMQFLTPLQVMRKDGGLKLAKHQAVQNIRGLLSQVEVDEVYSTIWRVCHPEVLTSSLLLCLDEFEALNNAHQSVQFSIPSRGTLYFATENLQHVESLIHQDFQRDPHPIRPDIFQTTRDRIQRFRHSWEGQ